MNPSDLPFKKLEYQFNPQEVSAYVLKETKGNRRRKPACIEQMKYRLLFLESVYGLLQSGDMDQMMNTYPVMRGIRNHGIRLLDPNRFPYFGLLAPIQLDKGGDDFWRLESEVKDSMIEAILALPGGREALQDVA